MRTFKFILTFLLVALGLVVGRSATNPPAFPLDSNQDRERTCFQTAEAWSGFGNLRSDVAIVYGIDPQLPNRLQTWRERGYRLHVMTGVSWGNYQDYLYGRFDGINHEDEAQTERNGQKISHGGDVYYMSPGTNFGKFLCVGVQRALDAGAEAIHLEEPEFWVRGGYSEGFQREWRAYYDEAWQPPHDSVDAQWRASKLKYFLYRRALQQVFDYVQDFNRRTGRHVRCYVPTHSLLNYAHWRIVSPESSLARLNGCDGYIAQVWTGTSRTPNLFRGQLRERTFETAFLEYGAMQNLVRATGRTVWYLNDPIEDNPNHDWNDYQRNWESTLVASLLQPDVWQYEVAPWPERVFRGRYPHGVPDDQRQPIPPAYATELQVVFNALNDMQQERIEWDCGTTGVGVMVSDSLMFQRGDPQPGDPHLSEIYGLALPLLKRGIPVAPVQLENVTVPHYLKDFRVLWLTYHGMKPLSADVHTALADWVKQGGRLIVCDDDSDPYHAVRDWWNTDGNHYATPREHLFAQLGFKATNATTAATQPLNWRHGQGEVFWLRENPVQLAKSAHGDEPVIQLTQRAAKSAGLKWREANYLQLRRGPYVIAAGLEESIAAEPKQLRGRFVNLFDPELQVQTSIEVKPGSRFFLRDLEGEHDQVPHLIASGCKALLQNQTDAAMTLAVEGVGNTPAVLLLRAAKPPRMVRFDVGATLNYSHSAKEGLLWIHFANDTQPRELTIQF